MVVAGLVENGIKTVQKVKMWVAVGRRGTYWTKFMSSVQSTINSQTLFYFLLPPHAPSVSNEHTLFNGARWFALSSRRFFVVLPHYHYASSSAAAATRRRHHVVPYHLLSHLWQMLREMVITLIASFVTQENDAQKSSPPILIRTEWKKGTITFVKSIEKSMSFSSEDYQKS